MALVDDGVCKTVQFILCSFGVFVRHKACVGMKPYVNAEVNSAVRGLQGCTRQAFRPIYFSREVQKFSHVLMYLVYTIACWPKHQTLKYADRIIS